MWFEAIVLKILYTEFSMIHPCVSLVAQTVKSLPAMRESQVQSPGQEDPLGKEMAIHSSIVAWKIPWRDKPGRLESMGLQRIGHDRVTHTHTHTHTHTPMGRNLIKLFHSKIHPWWYSFPCAQSSVLSDSLQLEPARLLCPWNFPGKNTGMGCHFLLQGIFSNPGIGNSCVSALAGRFLITSTT